jgi:chromosomal replication initiation ATPase DnaA
MTRDGPGQLPLPMGHRVAQGAQDFQVASGNRHAVEWIDRWPDWPFTALVVVGPEGSGKTHLTAVWRARSNAAAIDLATLDLEAAADAAAPGKGALVDDADRAVNASPVAELALLRLYNLARAAAGTVLLTAKAPPSAWGLGLADLRSRLNSAMVVDLGPPDDALLAAVALKQFADRQISPGEGVIPLLLSRGERSFAAIARAVAALDHAALAGKRPITVALARDIVARLDEG